MEGNNLIKIISELREKGFLMDFTIVEGGMLDNNEGKSFLPEHMKLVEMRRLEGASDPAEMVAVFGLEHKQGTDVRGIFIEPFGPKMSAEQAEVSRKFIDARKC